MIKVYIVEDQRYLLEDIVYCLNKQGYDCEGAVNASYFYKLINKQLPDVVILDWMLPDEDGLAIASELRGDSKTKNIGIIFLTARSNIDDRIMGLEVADSYQVKPIDYRELGAIINSVYRRSSVEIEAPDQPSWKLYEATLELHSPLGQIVYLSHRELVVLCELSRSAAANKPIAAQEIVELWNENWITYEKNRLELCLSRLRKKIKSISSSNINPIRAVRHEGYILIIKVEIEG